MMRRKKSRWVFFFKCRLYFKSFWNMWSCKSRCCLRGGKIMVKLRGDIMVVILVDSLTGIPLFVFHFIFYILVVSLRGNIMRASLLGPNWGLAVGPGDLILCEDEFSVVESFQSLEKIENNIHAIECFRTGVIITSWQIYEMLNKSNISGAIHLVIDSRSPTD